MQFALEINNLFDTWVNKTTIYLKKQTIDLKPKKLIQHIAEDILKTFENKALLENYNVYQHLMNYWNATMQDDCYIIAADGWKAEPYRIIVENKNGKKVDKGWACDLVPAELIINRYFIADKKAIEQLETQKETIAIQLQELEEEHSTEEGYFADFDKVNKANIQKRLKELTSNKKDKKVVAKNYSIAAEPETLYGEAAVLEQYIDLLETQSKLNTQIKEAIELLDQKTLAKYKTLTESDIKELVVNDKWIATIKLAIQTEMEHISQNLAQRIKTLALRYETPLPQQAEQLKKLEEKVNTHLFKMGFEWE